MFMGCEVRVGAAVNVFFSRALRPHSAAAEAMSSARHRAKPGSAGEK
jgi:hypothetical protein